MDSYRVGAILGRVVCNAFRPSFGSIWSYQGELRTSQAILEAGTGASNPIVASVAASIKEMAAKRQKLQLPLNVAGKKPEEVKAEVAVQLAKILHAGG